MSEAMDKTITDAFGDDIRVTVEEADGVRGVFVEIFCDDPTWTGTAEQALELADAIAKAAKQLSRAE